MGSQSMTGAPIGDWGNLPFLILDGCKDALERHRSSQAVLKTARLVNRWWGRWANGAITSLRVTVRPPGLPGCRSNASCALCTVVNKFVGLCELKVQIRNDGDASDLIPLQALKHLARLDLRMDYLSDEVFQRVGGLTALTQLEICGHCQGAQIPDTSLGHLDSLGSLKQLRLQLFGKISDAHLVQIGAWTGLQHLDLSDSTQITDAGMEHLGQLASLTHLDLSGCPQVGGTGFRLVANMTKLRYLDLGNCCLPDSLMMAIGMLTALTFLNFDGFPRPLCRRDAQLSDDGIAHIDGLTSLNHLGLKWCKDVTNMGIAHVGALISLTSLDLDYVSNITDSGLAFVGRLTALRGLSLKHCGRISNEGLYHVGHLACLRRLSLNSCRQVSDEGLLHIGKLTALTWLDLRHCNKISSMGLQVIGKLDSLTYLDIGYVGRIADVQSAQLGGLKMLRRLRLNQGAWDLRRLEQTLTDCKITLW
ncbi:unnamed protein product [Ostreobium quekettii]|uniref:F-box/LRR-repeat protein 15-like leucin rich repeat domain-containing protein n=1 Tax=Ostreobium quekettii TaxID=121088 RepID=A0A8S1J3A1_9CHLO|nr:unnamed protein product [Ostreobium quekettii]